MSPDHKIFEAARQAHLRKVREAARVADGHTTDPRLSRWKSIILARLGNEEAHNRLERASRTLTKSDAQFASLRMEAQELKTLEAVLISCGLNPQEC